MTLDSLKDLKHEEFQAFVEAVTKAVVADKDFISSMAKAFAGSHVCAFSPDDLSLLRTHCTRWRTAMNTAGLALVGAATIALLGFLARALWRYFIELATP